MNPATATPLRRAKASEAAAEHLLRRFVEGQLRPGDRIDLEEVAADLGVSRQPVREALVVLERDGIVRMPFHRGAFLDDIDAGAVREAFTLYAALSGMTARVAAERLTPELADRARAAAAPALGATVAMFYELHAREFRRVVNRAGAGAQLRALLRTFTGLVVAVSSVAVEADLAAEKELLAAELAALVAGDGPAAAAAAIAHVRATGERGVAVLVERGAIKPPPEGGAESQQRGAEGVQRGTEAVQSGAASVESGDVLGDVLAGVLAAITAERS